MNITKCTLLVFAGLSIIGCSKKRSSSMSDKQFASVLSKVGEGMSSSDTLAAMVSKMRIEPYAALGGPAIMTATTSTQTIDQTVACASGGSFTVVGSSTDVSEMNDAMTSTHIVSTMSMTQTFNSCVTVADDGSATIGGSITISGATADLTIALSGETSITASFTAPISGTVTMSGDATDASCTIDGTSTQQVTTTGGESSGTISWSGTACGKASETTTTIVNGVPQ